MAPTVTKHLDYRKMLEDNSRHIDAVIVATTDHHHAPCSALAMKMGKAVYCEKPLTLTVQEARDIRRIAGQTGVATQMGNQGAATDAFREQVELLQSGSLGEVRDAFVWCRLNDPGIRPLPTNSEQVPESLAWDLYLGPRAARPYNRSWVSWGQWRDFGTGQLGNWGSHAAAAMFHGLKLDTLWDAQQDSETRIRVRPRAAETNAHCFPTWEAIDFEFPARGNVPPVTAALAEGGRSARLPRQDSAFGWGVRQVAAGAWLSVRKGSTWPRATTRPTPCCLATAKSRVRRPESLPATSRQPRARVVGCHPRPSPAADVEL